MLWAVIIMLIVILDQITKKIVVKNIEFGSKIPVIKNFFYLTYHENSGAAWGILQNGRMLLIPLTIITAVILVYAIVKIDNKLVRFSLSFILGGAFGNLIDRIFKGSVADFLDFYFGSYNFPTFNVADCFIVIGTFMLVFYLIFIYKEQPVGTE